MDDNYLNSLLQSLGYAKELTAIKLIKDKATGVPAKYGFLEFNTHSAADHFYQNYNNRLIPNSHKYKSYHLDFLSSIGQLMEEERNHQISMLTKPPPRKCPFILGS
jgi:RNA recognition motif-containing protein